EGLVRVYVEGAAAGCIALEEALIARFALHFCRVVPDLGEPGLPLKGLGRAAGGYLQGALERGEHRLIGVGHGRTLAAMVDHLPRTGFPDLRFVSLLGGLPMRSLASPFDVIHRLAERTSAEAYLLPVPFFANTAADRAVLLAQRGVTEALAIAREATLFIVGIGDVSEEAFLGGVGAINAREMAALRAAGAVGEVLGRFVDAVGVPVASEMHERVIAVEPAAMAAREVLAVAGGAAKAAAILAVLRSGLLSALITDEPTARRLVEAGSERAGTERNQHQREKDRP
ncbi:MAG: sugar-binding transcriptional regulator, partial [Acetobacteraceae bacterium]